MPRVAIIADPLLYVTAIVISVTIVATVWVAPNRNRIKHKKVFTAVDAFFIARLLFLLWSACGQRSGKNFFHNRCCLTPGLVDRLDQFLAIGIRQLDRKFRQQIAARESRA